MRLPFPRKLTECINPSVISLGEERMAMASVKIYYRALGATEVIHPYILPYILLHILPYKTCILPYNTCIQTCICIRTYTHLAT